MKSCDYTWTDDGTRVSCQRAAIIRVGLPLLGDCYCEKHVGKHAAVSKYE
jgi:hypothetical protein